jgi:hypothetical protein
MNNYTPLSVQQLGSPVPPGKKTSMSMRSKVVLLSTFVLLMGVVSGYVLLSNRLSSNSQASGTVPSCPSGTNYLFSGTGDLKVGNSTNFGGRISSIVNGPSSIWTMENRDGRPMAKYGYTMAVEFSSSVYLDSVLIYDNDPKSGEHAWKLNGISLPTTSDNTWYPTAYSIHLNTNKLTFDYGGDSAHYNVCVKTVSASPTPKPTSTPSPSHSPTPSPTLVPSPTATPVPTATLTPTPTCTPRPACLDAVPRCLIPEPATGWCPTTPTLSPTSCPVPASVTNVRISCPICSGQQ